MTTRTYYIRLRGRVSGPFGLDELQQQAYQGILSPGNDVSQDGGSTWGRARMIPGLFGNPVATGGQSTHGQTSHSDIQKNSGQNRREEVTSHPPEPPRPPELPEPPEPPELPEPPCHRNEDERLSSLIPASLCGQLGSYIAVEGICTAGILLFCAFIPHMKMHGNLVWWWNLSAFSDSGLLAVVSVYAILAAIVLSVLVFLPRSQSVGWGFVITAGLSLLLLISMASLGTHSSAALGLGIMAVVTMGMLITGSIILDKLPDCKPLATAHIISAILSLVTSLATMLAALVSLMEFRGDNRLPAWALGAIIVLALGMLPTITCSIVALGSFRFARSGTRNIICVSLGLAGLTLLAGAGIIAGVGLAVSPAGELMGGRFVLVQILRLIVSSYFLAGLFAIGLSYILICRFVNSGQGKNSLL